MNFNTLLNISSEILSKVDSKPILSAKSINQEISFKKFLGSKDRKIISNLVFLYYKFLIKVTYITYNSKNDSKDLYKSKLFSLLHFFLQSTDIFEVDELLKLIKSFCKIENLDQDIAIWYSNELKIELNNVISIKSYISNKLVEITTLDNIQRLSLQHSFNLNFINNISSLLNSNLEQELAFLNQEATTDIRINSILLSLDTLKCQLIENNISFRDGQYSPTCIKLVKRYNLETFQFYKNGQIEVQDEGSQLICYSLNPSINSKILDACAGAGGKSLLLAHLTNNLSSILASDVSLDRMKELTKRRTNARFDSINLKVINDNNIKNYYSSFDYVLIDAPCSGSGTVRRNPFLKYNINHNTISNKTNIQRDLLHKYSKTVKVGGILVYATCSIFSAENEEIISNFLENNTNFKGDSLNEAFSTFGIDLKLDNVTYMTYLTPFRNNTDGFFFARLKRIC